MNDRCVRQTRSIEQPFSVREDDAGQDLYIEGYFAVFDSPYRIFDGAEEVILPGAFSGVTGSDVRALINHDSGLVLGRTKAGTLTLREDEHGLFGSIKVNRADSDAMNLYARVARGDVDQCSFGFDIGQERSEVMPDGTVRWSIEQVEPLYEVSVCTFPAYEATSCAARKRDFADVQRRALELKKEKLLTKLKGR